MLDYRGYGKSEGVISNQTQIFQDIQSTYNFIKQRYNENKIIVLGYSLGTGLAVKVASTNTPHLLILQAPYYSLSDMMRQKYYIVPRFLLKYPFNTNQYIKKCTMPVVIFHGNKDNVIAYTSSLKLQTLFKKQDRLITLNGQGHQNITDNPVYKTVIKTLLTSKATN